MKLGRAKCPLMVFLFMVATRVIGADIAEALRYAIACVSLNMEAPTPSPGICAGVEAYLRAFY